MKLRDLGLEEEEIRLLASAQETELGVAIVKGLDARSKMKQRELAENPQISKDVKKDFRHVAGSASGMNYLELHLIPACRKFVKGDIHVSIP